MDRIKIITRDNCEYCKMAKRQLSDNEIVFEEIEIGVDIAREDVIKQYPNIKFLPIVEINGTVIGGYTDLLKYLYPPPQF